MELDTVLLDLDGTLTDPGLGITNSIAHALREAGMAVPPREQLYRFIGPPLLEEFQAVYGLDEAGARRLLAGFRAYFEETGIWENRVYDGVPEMLARLREAGLRLVLATSKPEVFARRILERFGLMPYFHTVAGSDCAETRARKGQVVAYALEQSGARRALMVGDRRHDVDGARENGLPCLGVLYGYGSREELAAAGAAGLAETPAAAADWILARLERERA